MAALESVANNKPVHFKGFGRSLDFSNPTTRRYADALVDHVVEGDFTTLVWDGDSYSRGSFTNLIPRIVEEVLARRGRDLTLVSFLRDCDEARFQRDWASAPPLPGASWLERIRVELQPAALDWTQLGVVAIRATGAQHVVAFGGGPIVRLEYDANAAEASHDRAVWHWWPVERPSKDGTGVEQCSLVALEASISAAEKRYFRRHDVNSEQAGGDGSSGGGSGGSGAAAKRAQIKGRMEAPSRSCSSFAFMVMSKTRKCFERKVARCVTFQGFCEFLDDCAPHLLNEGRSTGMVRLKLSKGRETRVRSLTESLQAIDEAFRQQLEETRSTFDGILGFSQGAMMVGVLSVIKGWRESMKTIRGAAAFSSLSLRAQELINICEHCTTFTVPVLVSGFYPTDAALVELARMLPPPSESPSTPMHLPLPLRSFHCYGESDELVKSLFSAALHTMPSPDDTQSAEDRSEHRRMSTAIPCALRLDGDAETNTATTSLFEESLATVAIHSGGHLVPTDGGVRKAFRAFLVDVLAERAGEPRSRSSTEDDKRGAAKVRESGAAKQRKGAKQGNKQQRKGASSGAFEGRVLMLHGFTQTAEILQHRTSNIQKKIKPFFSSAHADGPFHFAEAPRLPRHLLLCHSDGEEKQEQPEPRAVGSEGRAWFLPGGVEKGDATVRPTF